MSLQAQDLQNMYATSAEEIMHSAYLLSNDNIVAVHSSNTATMDNSEFNEYRITFFKDTLKNMEADIADIIQSEVLIFDTDLQLKHQLNIPSNNDTLQLALHAVEDKYRNEIAILVGYLTEEVAGYYILVTDFELNTIYQVNIDPEDSKTDVISYIDDVFPVTEKFKFLVTTQKAIFYVNWEEEIIAHRDVSIRYTKYSVAFDNGDALTVQDSYGDTFFQTEDFSELEYAEFDFYDPKPIRYTTKAVKPNGKNYAYVSSFGLEAPFNNYSNDMLWRVHEDRTFEQVFSDTLNPSNTMYHPSFFALDTYDEENIFFCHNQDFCFFYHYPQDCTENLVIYNVNGLTGELNYMKYLGGDARYALLDIVALPNAEAIMFVARYEFGVNEQYETDTYFIKFDAEGNQIELDPELYTSSAVKPLSIPIFDVLVYPNPTTDFLNFKTHLNKNEIELNIYNINGQLVSQNQAITEMISVENLAKGVYIYELKDAKKVIQRGEFVKE